MEYRDKKIVIIGAGSTGRSLARFFLARGAQVVLSDRRSTECFDDLEELLSQGIQLDLGGHTLEQFMAADLIAVSPGVPLDTPVLDACQNNKIDWLANENITPLGWNQSLVL